jgi:hypothetical protein
MVLWQRKPKGPFAVSGTDFPATCPGKVTFISAIFGSKGVLQWHLPGKEAQEEAGKSSSTRFKVVFICFDP